MGDDGDDGSAAGRRSLIEELPAAFREYLQRHNIPLEVYDAPCPRYVRLTAGAAVDFASEDVAERRRFVASLLSVDGEVPRPVSWLPAGEWWELPHDVNLSRAEGYRSGSLFGMDAASGAAVLSLGVEPGHDVLDLCCAPGAKLVYLAEQLRGRGRLVGIDVAEHRLAACRTLCHKYKVGDVATLFSADGTSWCLRSWDLLERLRAAERDGHGKKGRKRRREQAMAEEAKTRGSGVSEDSFVLFDRVLVDAECTHDGSVRHIEKYRSQWGGLDGMDRRVPWLSSSQLEELVALQRGLLWNGWRQLRPGGVLVYSTCSLASAQNDEVVRWLLDREPTAAKLDALPFQLGPCGVPGARCPALQRDGEDGPAVAGRFDPVTSRTSGLFLARIRKVGAGSASSQPVGPEGSGGCQGA